MTLAAFLVISFGGTTLALLLRRWERVALAVGLVGLAASCGAALAMDPRDILAEAGSMGILCVRRTLR